MAQAKSTLQSILENVRDAGVAFGHRFAPPASISGELTKLLRELGIDDPGNPIANALASAAASWKTIADSLSGVSLDFADPPAAVAGLRQKGQLIQTAFDSILKAPENALNGLGASAAAIKTVFPERLLHYIIYEFITRSHEKIGGAFLLLGVLRREVKDMGGNPAFLKDTEIRVFDLAQLIRVLTHPRESFLTVMRWGTNDFLARPVVDGMVLLLGSIPGTTRGVVDDTLSLAEEETFVGPPDPNVRASARRTLTKAGVTLSFVGLHKHGVGLKVPSPVSFGGPMLPQLPVNGLLCVVPGPTPATDAPGVEIVKR